MCAGSVLDIAMNNAADRGGEASLKSRLVLIRLVKLNVNRRNKSIMVPNLEKGRKVLKKGNFWLRVTGVEFKKFSNRPRKGGLIWLYVFRAYIRHQDFLILAIILPISWCRMYTSGVKHQWMLPNCFPTDPAKPQKCGHSSKEWPHLLKNFQY